MRRQQKSNRPVVDLGRASTVTKGAWGPYADEVLMRIAHGLARD